MRLIAVLVCAGTMGAAGAPGFVTFESGQVRPLAMSPDGKLLFAANTPNGTLEVFDVTGAPPRLVARVPVGLEPVSIAVRSNTEVWVTNLLSDSVSVVSMAGTPRVVRTLLVGDEPRDIVFAGSPQRAFITTAHRGQHRTDPSIANVPGAGDPQFTTPGVPRADVWVFDPANLGGGVGGTPLRILSFFTDTPRALAVSPDGKTVYVAGFKTGNQTTTVHQGRVCTGFIANKPCTLPDGSLSPGGNPGPAVDASGELAPEVGLIVKFNNSTGHWEDELRRSWDSSIRFRLPDTDVFAMDANSLTQTAAYSHVGTTLFNMVVNPATGALYVSNTDARNEVRFEGPGKFAGHTVQGHLAESRVSVIAGGAVASRHLNKHLNYSVLAGAPGFDATAKSRSLSVPVDMAVSGDGKTLYVAAFGSSKVGVFGTKSIEDDSFNPVTASANYLTVSGGGPSGLALDEARGRLYVLTRFDDAVKVVDLRTGHESAAVRMANPEPASVVLGRPMLYDATRFSGNGEASCASCHIYGDMDDLAWDLGNPDGGVSTSQIPINFGGLIPFLVALNATGLNSPLNGSNKATDFHPMKGPFTTQTFRGMRFSGAMHWRGDRSTGALGSDAFDAVTSFLNFQPAFHDLVGSPDIPSRAEMQAFADFALQILPPPNPVRNLDNSLTASQQNGAAFYSGTRASDGIVSAALDAIVGKASFTCNGCHTLDPASGFYGTGGNQSFEGLPQIVKIPHLRNSYAKVGMFGTPAVGFFSAIDSGDMGDQVRGYGFTGDGSTDTLFRFLSAAVFNPTANTGFPEKNPDGTRRDVEQFILAFDSDLAPVVGQQVTLTASNAAAAAARISLLEARAAAPFVSKSLGGATTECDLVTTVVVGGKLVSYWYDPAGKAFVPSDSSPNLTDAGMRGLAGVSGQEVTYIAVPPGSGPRMAFGNAPEHRPPSKR